jgi:RNA polymerase sigma-70 factor (ECF subfamily)
VGLVSGFFSRREFSARLERRRERLYRMAFAWCHDRYLADDLVQQALCKALQKRTQLRDPAAMDGWLHRILANCLHDFYRRQRETEEFDPERGPRTESAMQVAEREDVVTQVRRAVATLPLAQRQVITLIDLEGSSYNDVAVALDIPLGTVMSRLCRARRALRDRLHPDMEPREETAGHHIRRVK